MSELLNLAVDAHGGLERWNKMNSMRVASPITGAIWFLKSRGDVLKNIVVVTDKKVERLVMDSSSQDERSIFGPRHVAIVKRDGTVIETWDNPESSFEGHARYTPWDDDHVAYFCGEALWTYLNTLLLHAGRLFEQRACTYACRGRDLAPVGGDLSGHDEEPFTSANLLLWSRRLVA